VAGALAFRVIRWSALPAAVSMIPQMPPISSVASDAARAATVKAASAFAERFARVVRRPGLAFGRVYLARHNVWPGGDERSINRGPHAGRGHCQESKWNWIA
jgi:hypothetical protein